ncbi:MAG TPA: hypothetical protein V6D05_07120, partial [Stenomitos sp.]
RIGAERSRRPLSLRGPPMLCALALVASLLFPNVQARNLSGQTLETRQQRGIPIVYLLAFTPEQRGEADAWKRAIAALTGGELRTVEMPVLSGFAVLIRPIIESSMTRKTPEAERPDRQITTDRTALVAGLRIPDPDRASVLALVDPEGVVRFTVRGLPTPESEAALRAAWEGLKRAR